jgi:hypothetical protein
MSNKPTAWLRLPHLAVLQIWGVDFEEDGAIAW